ncbi:hypothetical protein FRC07_002247 [Ceratobasidium sp. 392]|nr:hypothetical protein FRC07_002247 [Ceratobasidium sp. 392]
MTSFASGEDHASLAQRTEFVDSGSDTQAMIVATDQVANGEVAETEFEAKSGAEINERLPQERARNETEATRAPKKGRKANLSRILDLPPEVFNEIAIHLMPADLLSLARLNKFFRDMFMSRSSRTVWQMALHNVPVIKTPKVGHYFALRRDFQRLPHKPNLYNPNEWESNWVEDMETRREHGELLHEFLDDVEDEREMEILNLKLQRKNEIEARLFKNGWTQRDMDPSPANEGEWRKLVYQPKPITKRIWSNLYPKLMALLESNRDFNQQVDRLIRRRDCTRRLDNLVAKIRLALPPLVHVTLKHPLVDKTMEPSTTCASSVPDRPHSPYPDVKIDMPFPAMAELLTWPIIEDLIDADVPAGDFDQRFGEIRGQFDRGVVEWRDKIEQDLVDIWRHGHNEEGKNDAIDALPPITKVKGKGAERVGTGISDGH